MAIHTQLPIHKKGIKLLSLAFKAQVQMPRGVDFVGQVIKPHRRTLRRRTFNDAVSRLKSISADGLFQTGNSYFGLLRQASHSHHDRAIIGNAIRHRGHSIKADLTKTYRRPKRFAISEAVGL